ncbi:MAG: cadmium-translocating P-type ATPase [Planctomycetota bacterium]|nr:cadmium-translocating P-type ATPase [Planctomycetota bacterium]
MTTCAVCELHAESTFRVEGMDCHEEVKILERRLSRLSGLESLDADLFGQRLRIKYDAARLSTDAIAEAVSQTGMRAWLEHEQPAPPRGDWRRHMVVGSGVLFAAGLALQLFDGRVPAWPFLAGAVALGSVPTARRAWASIRARHLDIHVLMIVAVIGAVILGEWSEAASVVFLFALAQWLEAGAMERARGAIRALMELAPADALVRRNGREERVPVDEIVAGDTVLVGPGEKIPVDGRVIAGSGHVNQAPVTGESLPAEKDVGDDVFAGTINGRGALDIETTRLRRDSTLARIIHLVERAQAQRAPSQAFVDRFARIYTPIVLTLAILVGLVPPLAAGGAWDEWFYRALVLLVISCPCALVISTPVSIVSGLAAAARKGVLIKGGAHLEKLAQVTCVAFDKTGTLSRGRLHVQSITALNGETADSILALAAALERRSEHPIGRAIVERAQLGGLRIAESSSFRAVPGRGAEATVAGSVVLAGSLRFFSEASLLSTEIDAVVVHVSKSGATPVLVARDGVVVGVIGVADEIRPGAPEAVEVLRAQGIRHIALLTGDQQDVARAFGAATGVDEVRAELLPEDKLAAVAALRERHGVVAMVGDGVNDAPALAAADVGIAMGAAGTDVALETADVALMADELGKIAYAVRLSKATTRNIRANIAFSIVLKGAFLVMAVAGVATLWMAVAADMGASLLVIGNALRLLRE